MRRGAIRRSARRRRVEPPGVGAAAPAGGQQLRASTASSAGSAARRCRSTRARKASTWRLALLVAPAQLGRHQLGHRRGGAGGGGDVEEEGPGAAGEDVLQREGHLVADGVDRFGLEVGEAGHEPLAELGPVPHHGRHRLGVAAEPAGEVGDDVGGQAEPLAACRPGRAPRSPRRRRAASTPIGSPAPGAGRPAGLGRRRPVEPHDPDRLVDGVLGHGPVGGELAADDGDEPAGRHPDGVAAGEVGRLRGRAGPPSPVRPAGPPTSGRRPAQAPSTSWRPTGFGEPGVEGAEQVVDVGGGALRVLERAVVVGVGRADVDPVAPGDDEHRAPVAGDRQDGGDVEGRPPGRAG